MLIAAQSQEEIKELKKLLATEFEMKDLGPAKQILGMSIVRDRSTGKLTLSQQDYIGKVLSTFAMDECKPVATSLGAHFKLESSKGEEGTDQSVREHVLYANVVGSIMYALIGIRPDLAYPVGVISRFMGNLEKIHWDAVKWVLRYMKGTREFGLNYLPHTEFRVKGFCDSDYAPDLDKRRSLSGFVFMVGGNLVSWKSSLQHVVALSTTEAEYMALTETIKEGVWLRGLVEKLGFTQKEVEMFCDSQSAINLSKNRMHHELTKHIDIYLHFIRDILSQGVVKVQKVHTDHNPADALTKTIPVGKFRRILDLLKLTE